MSKITFTPKAWAAAGVVTAAAVANPAHAGLLSSTNPIITPPGGASTSSFANPWALSDGTSTSVTLQVDQFDSSLGMLQGVDLNFTSHYGSEISGVANLAECEYEGGSSPGTCSYAYSIDFDVKGSVTTPGGTQMQTVKASGTGSKDVVEDNFAPTTQFFPVNIASVTFPGTPLSLGSMPFPGYVGTSTWGLVFDVKIDLGSVAVSSICTDSGDSSCDSADLGGMLQSGGQVNWSVQNVQVTYHYMAPVPEPGSLLLVGAGLGAAGLARRRRNRSRKGQ